MTQPLTATTAWRGSARDRGTARLQCAQIAVVAAVALSALSSPRQAAGPQTGGPAGQPESAYLTAAEIGAKQEYELERHIQFAKIVRGNPKLREVALTFDDGPHGERTAQYLDVLKRERVKATFFLVGRMVDKYPELAQRMVAEGHEVANHTYDHLRLPTISVKQAEWELREGARAIDRAVGSPTRLFRPPGGEYDDETVDLVKRMGYVMVLWTDDPADFVSPAPGTIEERVVGRLSNGGILLLHDGLPNTLEVLPKLIRAIRAKGYKFVTCSQMARRGGVVIRGGPRIAPGKIPSAGQRPQRPARGVAFGRQQSG